MNHIKKGEFDIIESLIYATFDQQTLKHLQFLQVRIIVLG